MNIPQYMKNINCTGSFSRNQAVRKVALILTMSIDVYLVSVALAKDDTEYNEEVMSPKSDAAMDPRFLLRS